MEKITLEQARRLLVHEAGRWTGITESKEHDNGGQFIRKVQMAAVKKPYYEPWCMDFVHFCVNNVNDTINILTGREWDLLLRSESCIQVFHYYRSRGHTIYSKPAEGLVAIWSLGRGHGHCGIVEQVLIHGAFHTIEGNTSNPADPYGVQGVFRKFRYIEERPKEHPSWQLLGFIDPWDGMDAAKK